RLRFAAASVVVVFGFGACVGVGPQISEQTEASLANPANTLNGPGVGKFFYHRSHVDSSSVVTDATSGAEVSRMVYLPFGDLSQGNYGGGDIVTSKFTGQESDEETGLYYLNARYLDPSLGRFLSADTIVPNMTDGQSYNRYSYVRNNPVMLIDPTGHDESAP